MISVAVYLPVAAFIRGELSRHYQQLHGDDSWVGSTPFSPVPAPLHLLTLQLKPSETVNCYLVIALI